MAPRAGTPFLRRSTEVQKYRSTEVLKVRVLHPPFAQRLVGQIVHVLEDQQSGHQPRRQWWLPRPDPTDRTEASGQERPINLRRKPHQRMAKVDDLSKRWAKQIVPTIVARLAYGLPKGITNRLNPKSQNARKPRPAPGFLAKLNTCSRQITAINQQLPNTSRTTIEGTAN
jgi:hypothetical protein